MPDAIWWWKQDKAQRDVDRADEYMAARFAGWEKRLLSDEEARNRRLLDDEERRMSSVFDSDAMEEGDDLFEVRWDRDA